MISGHIGQLQEILPWFRRRCASRCSISRTPTSTPCPRATTTCQGKDIYVQVIDMTTKPVADCRPEVHRQYADVQFLVRGRERIGVAADTGAHRVGEDMLATRDLLFYADVQDEADADDAAGQLRRVHAQRRPPPGRRHRRPEPIRKVVIKVRVALLS